MPVRAIYDLKTYCYLLQIEQFNIETADLKPIDITTRPRGSQ